MDLACAMSFSVSSATSILPYNHALALSGSILGKCPRPAKRGRPAVHTVDSVANRLSSAAMMLEEPLPAA